MHVCQTAYRFSLGLGRVSTWCVSLYDQADWGSPERAECQSNAACVGRWPADLPPRCNPKTLFSPGHGALLQTPAKKPIIITIIVPPPPSSYHQHPHPPPPILIILILLLFNLIIIIIIILPK